MQDKTIALAAMVQSAYQVQSIARHNISDDTSVRCLLESLFRFQADSTAAIYSDEDNRLLGLQKGLRQLSAMTNAAAMEPADRESWRYVWLLMQLSKKLKQDDNRARRLGQLLHSFNSQYMVYQDDAQYQKDLAAVYQQVISQLSPKIMVYGDNGYLQRPGNAEKVRCVLLAGIRAGFLWWQLGGTRWQFMLPSIRKSYMQSAMQLLNS